MPRSTFLAWGYDDQDWALALELLEREESAARCGSCGTTVEDWKDPESGKLWAPPPFMVDATECPGCKALAEERAHTPDDKRSYTNMRFVPFEAEQPPEPASSDSDGAG